MKKENENPKTEQPDEKPEWERPALFPLDVADTQHGLGLSNNDGTSSS